MASTISFDRSTPTEPPKTSNIEELLESSSERLLIVGAAGALILFGLSWTLWLTLKVRNYHVRPHQA